MYQNVLTRFTCTGWKISEIGVFPVNSGGDTEFRLITVTSVEKPLWQRYAGEMSEMWLYSSDTGLDTLDTWFSSALWPFSTLGWPDNTEEMDYFYPTDVLVTGYDIIFFWVIRMVFSGLEQTGKTPFHHVLIHG